MIEPSPALLKKWNARLAAEGLSVWKGSDHRLVYVKALLDNMVTDSRSARRTGIANKDGKRSRCMVKIGGAGDSDHNLFLQQALQSLSSEEILLLQRYQRQTAPELAVVYGISLEAVKCRIKRLRGKLERVAKVLETRPF